MEQTPTRESPNYRWGAYPDHSDAGLYLNGPDDAVGMWGMQADILGNEAVALDAEYADRLRDWQHKDARRNFVQWLALHKNHWRFVKLAIHMWKHDPVKVAEFKGWLDSARRIRECQVEASKREALRLATR